MQKNLVRHIYTLWADSPEESPTSTESPAPDSPHYCFTRALTLTVKYRLSLERIGHLPLAPLELRASGLV